MASITWTDVTNHAAELASVSAGAQTDILAHVNTALNVTLFGDETSARLKLARIYLAAHLGTMANLGGVSGPVSSESAGGLAMSYAVAMTRSNLGITSYGRAYLATLPSVAWGPQVT
jgi:hypothetical protein